MKKMILHAAAMLGLALPLPASALCTLLCSCTVSTTSVDVEVYSGSRSVKLAQRCRTVSKNPMKI